MEEKKVTLRSIAREANVSVATVSRVLNNDPVVSDKLRKTVEKAAKDMNYVYKPKNNFKPKTRIGVLIADIQNEAYSPLLRGIFEVSENNNVEIILYDYARNRNLEEQLISTMIESRMDGIIAVPSNGELNDQYVKLISERFPLVLLISSKEQLERNDVFIVTKDSCEGSYTGTKYLLDLGHKDILVLGVPGDHGVYTSRLTGYKQAYDAVGIQTRDDLVCDCIDSFEEAYKTVSKRAEKLDFTAVFAVSDVLTLGAWKAIKDKGLNIPEDISIVGYGNQSMSVYLSLTSLAEPMIEIGKSATYAVLEWLRGTQTQPKRIILRDSLLIGDSCKKI